MCMSQWHWAVFWIVVEWMGLMSSACLENEGFAITELASKVYIKSLYWQSFVYSSKLYNDKSKFRYQILCDWKQRSCSCECSEEEKA